MQCPNHPRNEATGYCSVCGSFGCGECLVELARQLYCRKHYKQVARPVEEAKHTEARRRQPRQRLVVRFKDARTMYGMCFALNLKDEGFHLDRVDEKGVSIGETVQVRFEDLKAVFYVKSFDGKFDKSVRYRDWTPEGSELVVEFSDGETVQGYSLHSLTGSEKRFHLIPKDPNSNNVSIVVERTAVSGMYTPEEWEEKKSREREERRQNHEAVSDLSQEETMGDFYFETRNYHGALEQYAEALKKFPQSLRLRKKILLANYNMGVQHIKRREYTKALRYMENVLKMDPRNTHAHKKIVQLKRIIEKEQARDDAAT
jgi:tetratricopeptide (TPR) repeat protein